MDGGYLLPIWLKVLTHIQYQKESFMWLTPLMLIILVILSLAWNTQTAINSSTTTLS